MTHKSDICDFTEPDRSAVVQSEETKFMKTSGKTVPQEYFIPRKKDQPAAIDRTLSENPDKTNVERLLVESTEEKSDDDNFLQDSNYRYLSEKISTNKLVAEMYPKSKPMNTENSKPRPMLHQGNFVFEITRKQSHI